MTEAEDITRSAFTTAISFHDAAIRCFPSKDCPSINFFAQTVNIALACEIYLKGCLNAAGIPTKRHALRSLFDKILAKKQKEIEACYMAGLGSEHVPFKDALNEISEAFTDWRYVYEREKSELHIGAL